MQHNYLEEEALIARLSHNVPLPDTTTVVLMGNPLAFEAKTIPYTWSDRGSSLGLLDHLPPEIISLILDMLDMQSIARLARVSYQGFTFVKSHQEYCKLAVDAKDALTVFAAADIIALISVKDLYGALTKKYCSICKLFGPLVFLPTAERYCWMCLSWKPSLRMLLSYGFDRAIHLDFRYPHGLFPLYYIFGKRSDRRLGYTTRKSLSRKRVKTTKTFWGKIQGFVGKGAPNDAKKQDTSAPSLRDLLQDGQLLWSQTHARLTIMCQETSRSTYEFLYYNVFDYATIGHTVVPGVDLLCWGCETTLRERFGWPQHKNEQAEAVVNPSETRRLYLEQLNFVAQGRSRASFLEHIEQCQGAQLILTGVRNGDAASWNPPV